MDFYDRVNLLLKENKMTRKELGESIGISYDTINGLFKRRSYRIKLELVEKIASVLGTTTDYLAKGTSLNNNPHLDELISIFNSLPVRQQNEIMNFAYYVADKHKTEKEIS